MGRAVMGRAVGNPPAPTRVRATAPLAVAAALLAAALLGGCGGESGDDGEGNGRSNAEGRPSPAAAGPADGGAGSPADDGIPDDTLPSDELTPPAGEFTQQQEEYLTDRVPEGADPVAILELGVEACDRIGYLERHDRAAAVAALRDGEIPGAEDAVPHLCPEHTELLAEAGVAAGEGE